MNQDLFINIKLNSQTVDRYFARTENFRIIKENANGFKGRLLDFGCGQMPYRDYILKNSLITSYTGIDIENALDYNQVKPDLTWDGKILPLADNSFNTLIATQVLEHCYEYKQTLQEIYRVLDNEGLFFASVPFIWPLHETPHDFFRYTPFAIERLLMETGFKNITIKPMGGWNSFLSTAIALYLKRGLRTNSRIRKILIWIFLPLIKYLLKKDKHPEVFIENSISLGYYFICYK